MTTKTTDLFSIAQQAAKLWIEQGGSMDDHVDNLLWMMGIARTPALKKNIARIAWARFV